MSMLDIVNGLNTTPAVLNTMDEKALHRNIGVYGTYSKMAYAMYELTEKTAGEYSDKLEEHISICSEYAAEPTSVQKKQAFEERGGSELKLTESYGKYISEMADINSDGLAEMREKTGSERIADKGLMNRYLNMAVNNAALPDNNVWGERNVRIKEVTSFAACLDSNNSIEFLKVASGLNGKLEKLRQARDAKLAETDYDDEKHIYSFNSHQSFAYVDHPESEFGLERAYSVSAKKLGGDESLDERKEHYAHIIAEKKLEEKFDARKIGKLLNSGIVLEYMSFDPEEYKAMAEFAKEHDKNVNIPERLSEDRAAPVISASDQSELSAEGAQREESEGGFLSQNADNIHDILGYILELAEEIFSQSSTVKTILGAASSASDIVLYIKHIADIAQSEVDKHTANGDKDQAELEERHATAEGLKSLFDAASILFNIGGNDSASSALAAVNDAISIINSMIDISAANRSIEKIESGINEISGLNGGRADENAMGAKTQDLRILGAGRVAQRQNRAEAYLDTATSGMSFIADTLSAVDKFKIVTLTMKALTLLVKFAGKWGISKYFRNTLKDETWMNVLGFGKDEYKQLITELGGKSGKRFRNVIRRKTGLATREDYAKALLTTDAVDLYAVSKAMWVNRMIGGENYRAVNSGEIETVMNSLGFSDPKKYNNISLADICKKLNVDGNWRKTLAASIGKTEQWSEKDEAK